jgi:hypothetical protein
MYGDKPCLPAKRPGLAATSSRPSAAPRKLAAHVNAAQAAQVTTIRA